MTEKHGSPIESLGDDRKRKGSRIQGVEGSSGERQRIRWLEGWRVSEKSKGEGAKGESRGLEG